MKRNSKMHTCGMITTCMLLCIAVCASEESQAQKPFINTLYVTTDIKFHFATTLVTSIVHNPLENSSEVNFDITLPNAAFISNFTLEIDDQIYPASVKEKEEAKKEYERAKKKGQSAGHVASRPRETNKFRVQVNVAGGSVVVFNLTYQEVLQRLLGAYESVVYIDPGQPVEDMKVQVYIEENRPLTFLHVPPLKNELLTNIDITVQNKLAIVDRPSPKEAYILYQPSIAQQTEASASGISALFTVRYDVDRAYDAGDLLVVNGYFVHFLAPAISEPIPKDIVFILDTSGSMSGIKIFQLKKAMQVILHDLQEGDRFNIILFASSFTSWQKEMVPVSKKNIKKGLHFVDSAHPLDYTNINTALLRGLEVIGENFREGSQPIIMFLSDGVATAGERVSDVILANTRSKNFHDVPIYSLAFGKDADWSLSKRLSSDSEAVARRIYEDADATMQMTNFYKEVSTTLLTGVKVKYLEDQVDSNSLTTVEFKSFFNGSEMVVAGKLADSAQKLTVGVEAMSISGPVDLEVENDLSDLPSASSLTALSDVQTITEKMWAYLTIKEMVKQIDEATNETVKEQIKAKATQLSLKYNFVTPYTSMVVTKPEEESLGDFEEHDSQEYDHYDYDDPAAGYAGGDPHFMISLRSIPYPICFDVKGRAGKFYRLLKDPHYELAINTNMQEGITLSLVDGTPRVLMTKMVVRYKHVILHVTTEAILYRDQQLHWGTDMQVELEGTRVRVQGLLVRIALDFGVEILISKMIKHNEVPKRIDFLNIEIENEDFLSDATTGIIGQFAHKRIRMKERETVLRRVFADMWVEQDGTVLAKGVGVKRLRNNFVLHRNKTCIDVEVPTPLFEVKAETFVVPYLAYN